MNLVGYTATALSRNDIEDTPTNKNVVDFAIVELKDLNGNLVVMYDDAEGANPETQKVCDTNGQVDFFAEIGDYDLEINGKAQRINLAANIADYIKLGTGESVQEFADSFSLKIFQSPTDGGLTKIQTRTVNANEVYEVRKTSDDSLATIYSDAAGATEIVQNGTSNVSDSAGAVEFYVENTFDELKIEVGANSAKFKNNVFNSDKRYSVSFSSVSDMRNGLITDGANINWSKLVGSRVKWNGYYSASDGGSNWGIVKAGTISDDGGSAFQVGIGYYVEANLKGFRTSVAKFGAQGDGGVTSRETNSVAFENAIAYLESTNQVKLYVPTGRVGSKLYTMQRNITLKNDMTLYGDGMRESFLNFPAGVNGVVLRGDCKLKDIGIETVLDNTKFQNAITVSGDTADRPYRVFISRVFVGNFYRVIEANWMWASVIKSVHSINSGKGIEAKGITVNNVLKSCQLTGRDIRNDDAAVLIGDGTNATEGWMITQNLTFGFGVGLHLNKCSHCAMSNNIWDFCYKNGVLYSGVSINNKIVNDYFGMSDGATTGYYANQDADNTQSKGNKISQCDIVAYGTLQTGLRLSQYEHNARVDKVSVDSCSLSSIAVEGAPRNVRVTGCNFESDNATFGNNGQVRESLVYWNGNTGGIASSYVTIKFDDGLSVARYVSNTPSNGDYEVGDTAINRGSANAATYKWICTVAGTAGVDAVFKRVDYV